MILFQPGQRDFIYKAQQKTVDFPVHSISCSPKDVVSLKFSGRQSHVTAIIKRIEALSPDETRNILARFLEMELITPSLLRSAFLEKSALAHMQMGPFIDELERQQAGKEYDAERRWKGRRAFDEALSLPLLLAFDAINDSSIDYGRFRLQGGGDIEEALYGKIHEALGIRQPVEWMAELNSLMKLLGADDRLLLRNGDEEVPLLKEGRIELIPEGPINKCLAEKGLTREQAIEMGFLVRLGTLKPDEKITITTSTVPGQPPSIRKSRGKRLGPKNSLKLSSSI